jgi:hypothetical protein
MGMPRSVVVLRVGRVCCSLQRHASCVDDGCVDVVLDDHVLICDGVRKGAMNLCWCGAPCSDHLVACLV